MANQWFRFYAEFSSDPKVQMMPETYQRRLMMLFCFRCNGNETLHDEEIVFQLRVSPEEWQATKAEFIARNFIDQDNKILNWDKRQFVSDSSTARVSKHREKKKQGCNVSVTPPEQNRTEQNKKESKGKNKNGFSTLHFSDFRGVVINLDEAAYGKLFGQYCHDGNEERFRGVLQKRDDWYSTQPYKTQKNWLNDTVTWLAKKKRPETGWRKIQCPHNTTGRMGSNALEMQNEPQT